MLLRLEQPCSWHAATPEHNNEPNFAFPLSLSLLLSVCLLSFLLIKSQKRALWDDGTYLFLSCDNPRDDRTRNSINENESNKTWQFFAFLLQGRGPNNTHHRQWKILLLKEFQLLFDCHSRSLFSSKWVLKSLFFNWYELGSGKNSRTKYKTNNIHLSSHSYHTISFWHSSNSVQNFHLKIGSLDSNANSRTTA